MRDAQVMALAMPLNRKVVRPGMVGSVTILAALINFGVVGSAADLGAEPSAILGAALISGSSTVLVAVIGLFATRAGRGSKASRRRDHVRAREAQHRADRDRLNARVSELESDLRVAVGEIGRLEGICYAAGLNPHIGRLT